MLVLTRRIGETVVIGEGFNTSFTVLGINGNQVKIGVNAPRDVPILRQEIAIKIINENISMSNDINKLS
ncbi:MAG TPA: carbon storage regulator CsrA [Defluviitaleaceae bacterium]|nr:carbon storage regulator CsrA [Defluviitaleaceae bacterium]